MLSSKTGFLYRTAEGSGDVLTVSDSLQYSKHVKNESLVIWDSPKLYELYYYRD